MYGLHLVDDRDNSLKIASINNDNKCKNAGITTKYADNPSFKGSFLMNAFSISGALMQGIENKGYALSFLIQDGLGMTLPRTATGFYRDKEVTGDWNIKEGLEVLGREGLTGPFMISVAPFLLWLTGKFHKSAGTNTRLIKVLGNNFKEMLQNSKFNSELKNNKEAFRKAFIRYNIKKFYNDTIPEDKNAKETIKYIMDEFEKFNSKDKKAAEKACKNILERINDNLLKKSDNLDNICKLTINDSGKQQTFSAENVLKAINNFANDAITNNKDYKNIDEKAAQNITNNFATKRLLFNIAGIFTTLAGLSILPKIYAYNKVAPGSQRIAQNQAKKENAETQNTNKEISFKGKGINNKGLLSKIGEFLTKKVPAWFQQEFEYNGYNFTMSLMACLSLFGLLLPRGLRAYDRALVDENGNKDMTEIHEILLRDTISSLGVVYTVPIMQKGIISSYENSKGFILSNRASMNKTPFRKFIDAINPYSSLKLLSNSELQALYGNINSKEKMMNFIKYIDKKGGDIAKILSNSETASEVFNNKTFTLESIKKKDKSQKNKKIISFFEKMENNKLTDELITKLMNDKGLGKKSSISKVARGLSSIPGFLSTVIISPIILGWFIPRLTYINTRKTHAKMGLEEFSE